MASPEEDPNVVPSQPGPGPSLVHSPSGSESTASHVSFDPDSLPPDEQCLDYTPVFPGDWRQEDEEGLLALGWTGKPIHEYAYWQSYCPFWTSPTWDPTIETTIDGSMQKAVRGSGEVVMRPTILPRDEGVRRTEYTKRWGINEAFPKTSNDEARSGLTPTAPADPESERLWTQEESWQTYWFDGFTTQEHACHLSNYAHLLQSSWWEDDFQKFGHEALKISSTRADQSYPLQSTLAFRYNDFKSLLGILLNQGQNLILAWLSKVSFDIAGAKILRLRLHYERNTWDDKYGRIRDLCQRIVLNLTTASGDLQVHLDSGDPNTDWRQVDAQLDALFRHILLELHRLVDYEGRYGQCVAAEYFLKDLDDRWLVRRSMHILLGHLQSTHDQIGAVTTGMIELWQRMAAAGARFTGQVQECESLYGRLTTAQTAIQGVVQVLQGNTLDERSGPVGRGPLAAVPASRREFKNGRSLRIAAMKEFSRVTAPKVKRCIQTWLNILQFSQDIRHDDPDAVDVVVGGGTIAELKRATDQATADALAISYLDRQDQVEANRAKGMEPAEGENRVIDELQQEMAQLQTSSGIPDLFSQSFSEEEQNRLRRRRTI
ncbi:hypothetical protein SLS63_010361 [Diaporthe eres]|uniref:Uncharacterized protein n=1 Tax=Diaporthe eres TaxID=83184 RepID=A0ABR1NXA6_DIAER